MWDLFSIREVHAKPLIGNGYEHQFNDFLIVPMSCVCLLESYIMCGILIFFLVNCGILILQGTSAF